MVENKEDSETGLKSYIRWTPKQGGFQATMFIYVMAGIENMGFIASIASMVLYYMGVLHFNLSGAATTFTNFMGATFLLSIVGGFISDTYMTRLNTILIFGVLEILGFMMLAIQAHDKDLHPSACGKSSCMKGNKGVMFYSSLYLLALGAGGVRGALPALGADQFDQKDPKERKQMASFFNFLLLSITIGASIGVTVIVWISMNRGWDVGFFIAMTAAFVGFAIVTLGKPFYRTRAAGNSPLIRVLQVIVAAFRNRNLQLPEDSDELYEINDKEAYLEEEKILHTHQFRSLDRAAIIQEGSTPQPWRVCTVTQVEEVKILTRMMPIVASTIIMNTCLAQLQTFSVQQGSIMDLRLGHIDVQAPSIPVIPLVFMSILIPIYEFVFVPFARKITGHPSGITQLQRVGVGLVLSAISMGVAGIIEVKRRNAYNHDNVKISLFWLSFQYSIFGIADMFTLVGLMEFFYREAPAGMRSLSTSFSWLSLSFGFFLSSVFVELINSVTKRVTPSKKGWLYGDDLNNNNLNLFYWFLAILSCINFVNYLFWAKWYTYKTDAGEVEAIYTGSVVFTPSRGDEKKQGDDETVRGDVETTQGDDETKRGDVETTQGDDETKREDVETTQGDDTERKTNSPL